MNYPLIEFLNEKLKKDLVLFEYGSGFSTVFFARRTKKVVSIEYDKEWYQKVNDIIIKEVDNGIVHYEELNDFYPHAVEKHMKSEKCDIIVIDGRMRVKCAKLGYKYLSERGVVIFDDSFRKKYHEGIKFYKEKGFKTITFKGIKPTGFKTAQTTLLYRSDNCLEI
jgi:protein-L-isoaspartate O-methyltransferase